MRGTSDRTGGRGGEPRGAAPGPHERRPGARAPFPAVQTRAFRLGGEGIRIEVVAEDGSGATASLMPEAGRTVVTGAFLRRAVDAAREMAGGAALTVLSPAVTAAEARSFAEAGFVTTSELHLLTHDLTTPPRLVPRGPAAPVLRRGTSRDLSEALRVDRAAFAPGWTMTPHALANARSATPVTRLRVAARGGTGPSVDQMMGGDGRTGSDGTGGDRRAIVGYALTGRAGRRGYLQRLAVDPAQQRRGVGSALVLDAIRWCRRRGVQRLVVNTQVGNGPALELYHRMGFIESAGRLYTMELRTAPPDA